MLSHQFTLSRQLSVQEGFVRPTEPPIFSNEEVFKVRNGIKKGEKNIIAIIHDNNKPEIVQR